MGKSIEINLFKNKRTGQVVGTFSAKKLKEMKINIGNSKKMKVSIEKLYPT